jgi:hypothetical protein
MVGTSDSARALAPSRSGIWAQLQEESSSLRPIDIFVFALILGIGALQFFYTARSPDFLGEDVFWADSARSLVDHGYYGINGYAETNMPPGLPLMLALLRIAGAGGHAACLRVMVVFGALGFLASYELLRCQVPRGVAAAACLLLISSRVHFDFVTRQVWPSYPYFFVATCALLAARKLEHATHVTARIGWGALATALIAASLMTASVGIAFLGAMVMSICMAFFMDRRLAIGRLKTYAAVLLVGAVVQGYWMLSRGPVDASAGIGVQEWPVLGFPRSYLAQLPLKAGRHPELGLATLPDIGVRVVKNGAEYSNLLSRMLFQRMPDLAWMSVLVAGPLLLMAFGWGHSIWSNGGELQDWYFAGFWFIYLLWPWSAEIRFFVPVSALACLYMWRGGKALIFLAKNRPRVLGIVWLPLAALLTASAWLWMYGLGIARHLYNAGIEDEVSFMVWLLSACLAVWMVWANHGWLTPASALSRRHSKQTGALQMSPPRVARLFGVVAVPCLIVLGLTIQLASGRSNLDLNSETNRPGSDALAGEWIRSHTDTHSVVMARLVPTVSHYSERKVIWFPPSSDPQLLMEGIRKHGPQYVIVVRREYSFYLPPDDDCFAALLKIHPDTFRLVCQRPEFRVFQVVLNAAHSPGHAVRAVDERLWYSDGPEILGPSNQWKQEAGTGLHPPNHSSRDLRRPPSWL